MPPIFVGAALVIPAASGHLRAEPDTWDGRLDDLGIYYTEDEAPAGTWYWKLVSGTFEDENESGGTHHIYFKVLDEAALPMEGQKVWQAWPTGNPTGSASALTKGSLDQYWGNLAMFGGNWCPFWPEGGHGPYGAYVDGRSDEVWGMGLPCNRHVSYRLVWQWTRSPGAGDTRPSISARPASLHPRTIEGRSPAAETIWISNSGKGTLNYTATADASWLSVVPPGGTSSGEEDALSVEFQCESLEPGSYSAVISLRDPQATNDPQSVNVLLTVTAAGAEENLIVNGDFSQGLDGWSQWTERGTFTASVTDGKLSIRAEDFNGGVWQQFRTGGPGSMVPIRGFWVSQPWVASAQWAEVLIINGSRLPADGQDINESQADVVLVYKNDTWASPEGWSGDMDETSPVARQGEFTALDEVATIVLKSGNMGGKLTGTVFDDIFVGEEGAPGPLLSRGDANSDGLTDLSDAVTILMHLFLGRQGPSCLDAADANDDGKLDISDPVAILSFLFLGGERLSPACGLDPTPDDLDCEESSDCR